MKNTMILIAGRSGSGKDAYAKILAEKGLKGVKSYATRPKRFLNEDTHIFISEQEADNITDKVAITNINGYQYFATRTQVENADYYIIDPNGIKELTRNCPDVYFMIIYIYTDRNIREMRAMGRGDAEQQLEIFQKRDRSEDAQFSEFERNILTNKHIIIHNNNEKNMEILRKRALADISSYNNLTQTEMREDYLDIQAMQLGFDDYTDMILNI